MVVTLRSVIRAVVRVVVLTPILLLFSAVSMNMKAVGKATLDGVTLGDVPTVLGAIPNFPLVLAVTVGVAALAPSLPARSDFD